MEKRSLFEQMNTSAYKDTTDPFSALYEAGHFGNAEEFATASSETDPDTGAWRNGEPAKISHKLTSDEEEAQRSALNEPENEKDFEQPITGSGLGRNGDQEVPLHYDNDADIAVSYDPWSEEEVNQEAVGVDDTPTLETDELDDYNNMEDPEAILGDKEPGPGGEPDLGTSVTKLPNAKQEELIAKLDSPLTNKELMQVLADYLKKTIADETGEFDEI